MRTKIFLTTVISLTMSFGMFGIAGADPDGSQRLRGLGGRVFEVQVFDPDGNFLMPNCYTFYPDGTWDDPEFPELGAWNQDSNGARTSYSAAATALDFDIGDVGAPFLVTLQLDQTGTVTPARGKGVLQLEAYSVATIVEFGNLVVGEFVSVGYEVDECTL